ncbi:hypothetical protein JCM8097_003999 [Rhodosporidiobolus ruineniae]
MSTKRAASDAGSDEDASVTSSAKRQRTRNSSLPRSTPPADHNDRDFTPEDGSDEDMDDDDDEDEEQQRRDREEFERTQSSGRASKIAEAGVIQQVDLVNFMCHAHTTVNFGPQVNFLVGVNGSGKSAILTGITMALGGNARATNRGQKGGDLIMEDKPSARCSVTLANKGDDAFQHHIYGDSITVERTMNKSGGGAYKIKNHEGKTVDTKKATLDAILDSFNIQVDNPMTVLTQDQSRQFLASASPKDKYTFFLRGTQLAQLTEEYEQIRSNTEAMEEHLSRKKEVLPELKEQYREAKTRAKDAQAAIDQTKNLQTLKDQLAWSFVVQMEEQIAYGEGEIAQQEAEVAGVDAEIEQQQTIIADAEEKVATTQEAEAEMAQTGETYTPRLAEIETALQKERDRIKAWKNSERQLNSTSERISQTIDTFDKQIADEERKLSRDLEAERKPLRESIARSEAEAETLSATIVETKRREEEIEGEYRRAVAEYDEVKERIAEAGQQLQEAQGKAEHMQRTQNTPLYAYGPRMPEFKAAIEQEHRWKEKPIGPVGMELTLLEPKYAVMLESFFERTLNAVVTSNDHDFNLLRQIRNRLGLDGNTPIIRQLPDDRFNDDLGTGEPVPEIQTILRALKFKHPLAREYLIVNKGIEKAALVPFRPDGDQLVRANPHNVSAAYASDSYKVGMTSGRSYSQAMSRWSGPARFTPDYTAQIQAALQDVERVRRDIADLEMRKQQVGARAQQLDQERKAARTTLEKAQYRIRQLNHSIHQWQSKLTEEQPNNIAALQQNREEALAELESAQAQFRAGKAKFESEAADNEAIVLEKKDLEAKIKKAQKIAVQIQNALQKEYGIISSAREDIKALQKRKDKATAKLDTWKAEVQDVKKKCEERTELAEAICARPPTASHKKPEKLQKEIDALDKALRAREKRQGGTIEQILEQLAIRKKVAEEAVRQTNELSSLIQESILSAFDRLDQALGAAYQQRILRWTDFRDHIGQRARMQFLAYLSNRGFTGKLKFDHEACRLNLTVQTDAEEGSKKTTKARLKDAKSLSGGEKSFSTICLLLTMWEAVGCPIRCLDEFDVFMDAVNRRIAMKMMVETAKTANGVQFILITPQDMGSFQWGDEVKVSKLEDPKRARGALARGA